VLFRYAVVVLFGASREAAEQLLAAVAPFVTEPYAVPEQEPAQLVIRPGTDQHVGSARADRPRRIRYSPSARAAFSASGTDRGCGPAGRPEVRRFARAVGAAWGIDRFLAVSGGRAAHGGHLMSAAPATD